MYCTKIKMKNQNLIIIMIIVAIIIISIIIIANITGKNNQKTQANDLKKEEFTVENTNGDKANTSDALKKERTELEYYISNITLEKKATYLENNGDDSYKLVDEEIRKKSDILNSKQVYIEYLNKMEEFNDELAMSSRIINDYIEEKV